MKRLLLFLILISMIFCMCGKKSTVQDRSNVLISKYFQDDSTYVVICKGFPKEGLADEVQKIETAKEAALLNAQMIAKETFKNSVDVIKLGSVDSYAVMEGFATVKYVLKDPALKASLREAIPNIE